LAALRNKRGISKKPAFLAAFATTASITRAAAAATIDRTLHYRWLEEDAEYAAAFARAQLEAAQSLEDEAVRRAHQGLAEPIVYQGQFQYRKRLKKGTGPGTGRKAVYENYGAPLAIRKYSDQLLMFLLRGFRPAKYRDNATVELSGRDGAPIPVEVTRLSDDDLTQLIAIHKKMHPEDQP
jgi:hypothetical protein